MSQISRRDFLKSAATYTAAAGVLSASGLQLRANPLGMPIGCQTWPVREMIDAALVKLSPVFDEIYSSTGRPSIAPEKLLRALLLQVLYSVRSERMLMEQLQYNLLFRWFVGLDMDEEVWVATVYSKNRDRLLEGDIAQAQRPFLYQIEQPDREGLL